MLEGVSIDIKNYFIIIFFKDYHHKLLKSGSQPRAGDVQRREHVDVAQVHRKTSLVMMMMVMTMMMVMMVMMMVKMMIVMMMMVMILMMMMARTSAQVHRKTWLTHFSLNDHEVDGGLD